jgi:EAL domain-containing protein (putative c-di-GMP-specific phosphodiesterase class I)/ActR/RegA family two-component response regulator
MTVTVILPESLKSQRVLLVDDDDFMLDLIEETLRQLGIENLSRATSGTEALAQIDALSEPLQLIICDLNMPEMDGIELVRHLSSRNYDGGVILLSGSDARLLDTVGNLLREHKLNFLGALEKPLDVAALVAVMMKPIDAALKGGGAYAEMEMLTPDEIRAGLKTGCVETFFQPKVAVAGRHVLGAECLLRWRHPERGLVSPLAVIPVAEEHDLIDELTLAVFAKAMWHLGEWTRQGHALTVSVNISVDNLKRLDLPDVLADIARKAGVDPSQVVLEITESRLMSKLSTSLEIITRMRLMGFGLSIDDFGTGYSNMEILKQMPFSELKVDRAFVCGATSDPVARAIFESSVNLGHALNMQVVAEGVETQADWDLVATVGCDQLQGYDVAKPMPAGKLINWKTGWEKRSALHRARVR